MGEYHIVEGEAPPDAADISGETTPKALRGP